MHVCMYIYIYIYQQFVHLLVFCFNLWTHIYGYFLPFSRPHFTFLLGVRPKSSTHPSAKEDKPDGTKSKGILYRVEVQSKLAPPIYVP